MSDYLVSHTVSCSKWKREKQQCGKCVPCIIRRASLLAASIHESTLYKCQNLSIALRDPKNRDDIFALMIAIEKLSTAHVDNWISHSGPLSENMTTREKYQKIFKRGIREVETFLRHEGII